MSGTTIGLISLVVGVIAAGTYGYWIGKIRLKKNTAPAGKVAKWNLFFEMQHPEQKKILLGTFEGTAADAVEEAYMEQMNFAYTYMNNHREPNMVVMGNYGIEEVRDEPAAAS